MIFTFGFTVWVIPPWYWQAAGIAANRQAFIRLRSLGVLQCISVFAGGCYSAALAVSSMDPMPAAFQEKPLIRRFYSAGFMIGIRPLCFFLRRV